MGDPDEINQQYNDAVGQNPNNNYNYPQQHEIEQRQPEGMNYNINLNQNNNMQIPVHPEYANNDDFPPIVEIKNQPNKGEESNEGIN